jgi:hypothetical protein
VFLGSITRVTVRLDGNGDSGAAGAQPVMLELAGRRDDLAPGMTLAIRIPAHALLRLR